MELISCANSCSCITCSCFLDTDIKFEITGINNMVLDILDRTSLFFHGKTAGSYSFFMLLGDIGFVNQIDTIGEVYKGFGISTRDNIAHMIVFV